MKILRKGENDGSARGYAKTQGSADPASSAALILSVPRTLFPFPVETRTAVATMCYIPVPCARLV